MHSLQLFLLITFSAHALTAGTLDTVLQKKHLRVGTTGDYTPFTIKNPGKEYKGLDIEMAHSLGRKLSVKVQFVPTTWKTLMAGLLKGKYDIAMGGISVNAQRKQQAFFSVPYRSGGKAVITKCGNKDRYRTLKQIDKPGVRVIFNPGGTNEKFVRAKLTKSLLILHKDNKTIFDALDDGKADLMITDAVEARIQANKFQSLCAVRARKPFTSSQMAYLLPKDDDKWKAYVDKWLNGELKSGSFRKLKARWIP